MTGPSDPFDDRDPLERLAEEYLERARRGERPTVEEYARLHPELAAEIRELLPAMVEVDGLAAGGTSGRTRLAGEPAAAPPPELASVGPYRIERELGRGGMGVVYLAEDTRLHRKVALKVLSPEYASFGQFQKRFEREAAVASRLDHPGICTVYDAGEQEGVDYIAMRYVEGESLADWVAARQGEAGKAEGLSRTMGDIHSREGVSRTCA